MKLIPLTQGHSAQVDDEDYSQLMQFSWQYKDGYAKRHDGKKVIPMHYDILRKAVRVDHKDRNPLNYCKTNLRPCTFAQNMQNKVQPTSKSGFRGVYKFKDKWQAIITHANTRVYLGCYSSANLAAKAYNTAAEKYHGEFAILNSGV